MIKIRRKTVKVKSKADDSKLVIEPNQTSMMEFFCKNGAFQQKGFIIDVKLGSE